ncbi:alpha-beta hydrolase superfamily lysophospholipase [Agrobacterium vitis]|nr:alpha-beta hydrolase superfamily lysophospholipase [Agrobacterium vitis]MBE1440350.1 alpha-beta hydrolase superfamily lysophospholipase [Agrobacterium vitis]
MTTQPGSQINSPSQMVETRKFVGRRSESEAALAELTDDAQAALRQFSLERKMGYGIDYSDAVELRSRVMCGETWQSASTVLAEACLSGVHGANTATQIAYLRRASALIRMSQAMMLTDTDERRAIYARAADIYARAAELSGDCRRILIDSSGKALAGWYFPAQKQAAASVIVIGGIEGWAMDFDSLGQSLAARGVNVLMLDGPGQGETRLTHHHYLGADWREAYRSVLDHVEELAPDLPIGLIGNSMGGSIMMAIASEDQRIGACCNNGGPFAPWMAPQGTTFFSKMISFCGVETSDEAIEMWKTVPPLVGGANAGYPLLMVHGAEDPLISNDIAALLYERAPTQDKRMVVFSDGDHCIYRHKQDRDILISDWMISRLCPLPASGERQSS